MSAMTAVASWSARAACITADPDLFFPEPTTPAERVEEAKSICAGCPVKQDCLDDAFRRNETEALCGGLTAAERRELLNPDSARPLDSSRVRALGRTSAREMAVKHGTYLLTCLVQWQMSVQEVAAELGATPQSVYGAYRILVPARPGRRDVGKASAIEKLLTESKETLKAMERRGYAHADIGEALGTSQSIASASLAVLRQCEEAIRRLSLDGQDGMQRLLDSEAQIRQEAGVGLTAADVIDLAGSRILVMYGEGVPLRQVARELGLCRETVRRAHRQMTQPRLMKELSKNEIGAAA